MIIVTLSVTLNIISITEGEISLKDAKSEETSNLVESCTEELLLKARFDDNYEGGIIDLLYGQCIITINKETSCNGGGSGEVEDEELYEYSIISNDDIVISTNADILLDNSYIHADRNFDIDFDNELFADLITVRNRFRANDNTTIHSDVTAKRIDLSGGSNIIGNQTLDNNIDQLDLPNIDLAPYIQHAQDNGEYYNNSQFFFNSGEIKPVGGIMYVDGWITVINGGNMEGCFIANRGILILGDTTIQPVHNYPTLVSETRNVSLSGNSSAEGLIYAPAGHIEKSGNGYFNGQFFTGREFRLNGTIGEINFIKSIPYPPGEVCTTTIWDTTIISTYKDHTKTVKLELEKNGEEIQVNNMEEID